MRCSSWGAPGFLALLLSACLGAPAQVGGLGAPASSRADALLIVDCLLPGQIRKLGSKLTFATPRRPVKTTAGDCEIRGGEYVAYDRASYATALEVWLPAAQQGDPKAQTYVGEIYEKGLGAEPDYEAAGVWYRRAAEQGWGRAQINLGQLYELGRGVPHDPAEAVRWYRRASGLADSQIAYLPAAAPARPEPPGVPSAEEGREALEREIERLRAELARVREERGQEEAESETDRRAFQAAQQEVEAARKEVAAEAARLRAERQTVEARMAAAGSSEAEHAERLAALRREEEALRERRDAIEARASAVAARERALAGRSEEVARLDAEIARLNREKERRQGEAPAAPATAPAPEPVDVELPGPTIHLIEPAIPETRGLQVVASVAPAGAAQLLVGRVEAPAGILAVTLNGAEAAVDERGIFQGRLDAAEVAIVAIDRQGKRAARTFRFAPEESPRVPERASVPAAEPSVDFGRYLALVIGNDAYQGLPRLSTAVNDANAVAQMLERRYGFRVRLLRNATRYEILSALNELRAELTEDDNFLLYYAGHGELDEANARGHWLPVDAEPGSSANWISNVAVTDILNAMSARHVLVVADSCYSGALTRSTLARLDAGMTEEAREAWLRAMREKRARLALTSGGLKPVLDRGGGEHSIFARVFLDVLRDNEEVLEGARLFGALSARVTWAAEGVRFEQVPQYAPIRFAGHESGDFFFVPRP